MEHETRSCGGTTAAAVSTLIHDRPSTTAGCLFGWKRGSKPKTCHASCGVLETGLLYVLSKLLTNASVWYSIAVDMDVK